MTTETQKRLSRLLGDNLGRNVHGKPLYQWMQNRELTMPAPRGTDNWVTRGGIMIRETDVQIMPHIEGDRWVLAMWLAPPSRVTWVEQFGFDVAYPENGYYFPTDCILKIGLDPDEGLTQEAIGALRRLRHLTRSDMKQHFESREAASERSTDGEIGDFIHDKMTAFGQVPGLRSGNTSLPEKRPGFKEAVITQ